MIHFIYYFANSQSDFSVMLPNFCHQKGSNVPRCLKGKERVLQSQGQRACIQTLKAMLSSLQPAREDGHSSPPHRPSTPPPSSLLSRLPSSPSTPSPKIINIITTLFFFFEIFSKIVYILSKWIEYAGLWLHESLELLESSKVNRKEPLRTLEQHTEWYGQTTGKKKVGFGACSE